MGLTKSKVLDAALAIVDEDGLEAFTARRLAKRLGVSVMAPYRHFADQQALLAALLDHAVDPRKVVANEGDACAVLVESFTRVYELFIAHPALIALAGTPASLGPNSLVFIEELLGHLQKDVSPEVAGRAVHRVLTYTLGCAMLAAAARKSDAVATAAARFADFDPAKVPHLIASAPELLRLPSRESFRGGLVLIASESLRTTGEPST